MLKKEGNMARRWFLIDEKVRFVIAGIVNMAIRYLIFVLLGLAFSVSRYQLVLLATWLLSSVIAFFSYKHLVFRTEGNHLKEFVKSLLIWCLSYVLNAALLEGLFGAGGGDRFDRGGQLSFVQTFCLPPTKEEFA